VQARTHWPSALQFGLSSIAALLALAGGLSMLLLGMMGAFLPFPASQGFQGVTVFMLAASSIFTGLLLLPSAWYSLQRLLGHPERAQAPHSWRISVFGWLFSLVVVIGVGYFVSVQSGLLAYFLPALHVLAVGLTAALIFSIGSRKLVVGSNQRFWGVFASGLMLGPFLILLIEGSILLVLLVVAIASLASVPGLMQQLLAIAEQMQTSPQAAEELLAVLRPYLSSPLVIYTVLAFTAGMVPLVEELFKPIGVWLLFSRPLTAAQGFTAGMLSGAGYGLFESLSLANGGDGWAFLVIARSGTTLLHIFTAGLVGWGLALAFSKGKYLNLALAYLAAVTLHGLWNGLSILSSGSALLGEDATSSSLLNFLSQAAPVALVGLAVLLFILLVWCNYYFVRQHQEPVVRVYNETLLPESTVDNKNSGDYST
jgi:hypothetical protein